MAKVAPRPCQSSRGPDVGHTDAHPWGPAGPAGAAPTRSPASTAAAPPCTCGESCGSSGPALGPATQAGKLQARSLGTGLSATGLKSWGCELLGVCPLPTADRVSCPAGGWFGGSYGDICPGLSPPPRGQPSPWGSSVVLRSSFSAAAEHGVLGGGDSMWPP